MQNYIQKLFYSDEYTEVELIELEKRPIIENEVNQYQDRCTENMYPLFMPQIFWYNTNPRMNLDQMTDRWSRFFCYNYAEELFLMKKLCD